MRLKVTNAYVASFEWLRNRGIWIYEIKRLRLDVLEFIYVLILFKGYSIELFVSIFISQVIYLEKIKKINVMPPKI